MFTSAGNVYLVGDPAAVAANRALVRTWARDQLASCIGDSALPTR